MTIVSDINAAIAATRFGLGAKAGELASMGGDPRGYLLSQIRPQGAELPWADGPTTAQRFQQFHQYQQDRRAAVMAGAAKSDTLVGAGQALRQDMNADFLARLKLASTTDASFRERWALFWANHFTVTAAKLTTTTLVGPFEQEAIRPHVFGRFEDLLIASSSHPAMLFYLDQAQSVGPDSAVGLMQARAARHAGLNENLAREILELHTVGVDAGYSQADVTEFARALTGWSIEGLKQTDGPAGAFVFREAAHEPGTRSILGRAYSEGGQGQARAVMRDLAASPHTAHHVAVKLARHFVADDAPPSLVDQLTKRYLATNGDLAAVAETLIKSPDSWSPVAAKFKTPYDFLVSSWRATGASPTDMNKIGSALIAMGQKPYGAPSPKGWPEDAQTWCAPDAVVKRMAWSVIFAAEVVGDRNPTVIAHEALGARLTPLAAQTIARAETRAEGLAILLMSPEFQRR